MTKDHNLERARALVREAIDIFDDHGEAIPASYLQLAIDRLSVPAARVEEPRRDWGVEDSVRPQAPDERDAG